MLDHKLRQLSADFWVAGQLEPEDFAELAKRGFRTVINNRPDGEEPGQLPSAEAERLCREHGLAYFHVPVVSGSIFPDHVAAMADVMAESRGPWLAYCRSGARCCCLWALVSARRRPPVELVEAAAKAGYDLRGLWPQLESIHAAAREPVAAK